MRFCLNLLETEVLLNSYDEILASLKLTGVLPLIPAGLRSQISAGYAIILSLLSCCVLVADLITLHCFILFSNE